MARVHREAAGKGAAEHLVGGNEGFEPFVDLAVHPLLALLDGGHHDEANADADQREQGDADKGGEDALPGGEVKAAQVSGLRWWGEFGMKDDC